MTDNLQSITDTLRGFAHDRAWEQFHSVRNLVLALVGEVGEIAELVQWKSDEEVTDWLGGQIGREQLGQELADVLLYLVRLSDVAGVDLMKAAQEKISLNSVRYPVEKSHGTAKKHTELG